MALCKGIFLYILYAIPNINATGFSKMSISVKHRSTGTSMKNFLFWFRNDCCGIIAQNVENKRIQNANMDYIADRHHKFIYASYKHKSTPSMTSWDIMIM